MQNCDLNLPVLLVSSPVAWRRSIVQNCDLEPACSTGWFSCCLEEVDPAEL